MRIGFFDSGIGGWSFLRKVEKAFPFHDYLYFADQKNCPYGNKSMEELESIVEQWIMVFKEEQLDVLVVACNTMTVLFKEKIQRSLEIPVIGTTDGINEMLFRNKKVVLLATQKTVESGWYDRNLSSIDLISVGNSWLANAIEEDMRLSSLQKLILEREVQKVAGEDWDLMILGCTHYPLVRKQLEEIWDYKEFFDPAERVVEVLKVLVGAELKKEEGYSRIRMFTTGNKEVFEKQINSFFGEMTAKKIECEMLKVKVI